MFEIIAVTNRHLSRKPFLEQLEGIAAAGVQAVILREKDLAPQTYFELALQARAICQRYNTALIPHTFTDAALRLKSASIHLPLPMLTANPDISRNFTRVGASVHSVDEALEASRLGADYLIAGHIFATASKDGATPKGPALLHEIRAAVDLPLYAIGGVTPQNITAVKRCRVNGVCIMSGLMQAEDPDAYLKELHAAAIQ